MAPGAAGSIRGAWWSTNGGRQREHTTAGGGRERTHKPIEPRSRLTPFRSACLALAGHSTWRECSGSQVDRPES